jgi:hypothetical protein
MCALGNERKAMGVDEFSNINHELDVQPDCRPDPTLPKPHEGNSNETVHIFRQRSVGLTSHMCSPSAPADDQENMLGTSQRGSQHIHVGIGMRKLIKHNKHKRQNKQNMLHLC